MKLKTIKAKKCLTGTVYYLTGNWWANGEPLTNTPVRLKYTPTEKWTETVLGGYSKRKQQKYWIFESTEDPKLTITALPYDSLFLAPYVPTQQENPVDTTV